MLLRLCSSFVHVVHIFLLNKTHAISLYIVASERYLGNIYEWRATSLRTYVFSYNFYANSDTLPKYHTSIYQDLFEHSR
jgi:hypothetical protein